MLAGHECVVALVSVLRAPDGTREELRDALNPVNAALIPAQFQLEDVVPVGPQQVHEFGVSCPHKVEAFLAVCPEDLAQHQGPTCPKSVLAPAENLKFRPLHIDLEQEVGFDSDRARTRSGGRD